MFGKTSDSIKAADIYVLMIAILDTVRNNEQLIRIMDDAARNRNFIRRLIELCFRDMDGWLKYYSEGSLSEKEQIIGSVFLTGGCSNVVEHWLHNGMKDSPEKIAGMIDVISKSVAERLAEL